MEITVRLASVLREGRFAEGRLDLAAGANLGQVLPALAIGPEEVGAAFVNGRQAGYGQVLAPGDVVSLLPQLDGG